MMLSQLSGVGLRENARTLSLHPGGGLPAGWSSSSIFSRSGQASAARASLASAPASSARFISIRCTIKGRADPPWIQADRSCSSRFSSSALIAVVLRLHGRTFMISCRDIEPHTQRSGQLDRVRLPQERLIPYDALVFRVTFPSN